MTTSNEQTTPHQQARERAKYLTGLMWHAGAFAIINVFLWILDSWSSGTIDWSILVTVSWGFALAFHALAYLIDGRQVEERKTEQFLNEHREREDAS